MVYWRILNIVPYARQWFLVAYSFYYKSFPPQLPSPWQPRVCSLHRQTYFLSSISYGELQHFYVINEKVDFCRLVVEFRCYSTFFDSLSSSYNPMGYAVTKHSFIPSPRFYVVLTEHPLKSCHWWNKDEWGIVLSHQHSWAQWESHGQVQSSLYFWVSLLVKVILAFIHLKIICCYVSMLGTGRIRLKKCTEKKQMLQSIQKQRQGEIKNPEAKQKTPKHILRWPLL